MRKTVKRTRKQKGGGSPVTIIGVAGGSGSGKTETAHMIADSIKSSNSDPTTEVYVISMDDYYKETTHKNHKGDLIRMPSDHDWDSPEAYDIDRLVSDLTDLKQGCPIYVPTFNFKTHLVSIERSKRIRPTANQYIVLEGLFALHNDLLPLLDHKIFIDLDVKEATRRRVKRNTKRYAGVKTVAQIKDEQPPINKKYAPWISRFRAVADEIIDTGTGLSRPGGQEASY